MKKIMSALIIVGMLTCSICFMILAHALQGDINWRKTSNPSDYTDMAMGVAIDSIDVYIVGYDSSDARWRIDKRGLTDGSLIWKKKANPSSSADHAHTVAVYDNSVYIAGYDSKPGNARWRIEKRSKTDGSRTWVKTSNPSSEGDDEALGLAVFGTNVYIVGYDKVKGNARWRIEKRSTSHGSLIWKKTVNPSGGDDKAYSVAVDDTGVYIVGYDYKPGDYRWRIEKRSNSDGSLIWKKTSNPSPGWDKAFSVAVDDTGVYIVGYDHKPGDYRWRIEKRDPSNGSLIWKKFSNPSGDDDMARSVAVNGTGFYIVGYDSKFGNARWRMEKRNTTDGSRIWTKISNPSSGTDIAHGVAVDGSSVYAVGYDYVKGNERWRIEKRRACEYGDVTVEQAKKLIEGKPSLVILDVRTETEYDEGHIEGAINIPVDELEGRLNEIDAEDELLVHCKSGYRSSIAVDILLENDFYKIYHMLGGILAWIDAGYPIVT